MTASDWVAIYGAVVATAVALLQYRSMAQSAKFLHLDETFWIRPRDEIDDEDMDDVSVGDDNDEEALPLAEDGVNSSVSTFPIEAIR